VQVIVVDSIMLHQQTAERYLTVLVQLLDTQCGLTSLARWYHCPAPASPRGLYVISLQITTTVLHGIAKRRKLLQYETKRIWIFREHV